MAAGPLSPRVLLEAVSDLAAMSVDLGDRNPRYLDQQKKVAVLQRDLRVRTAEPEPLRVARARLDYDKSRYGANHPVRQQQERTVAELEKDGSAQAGDQPRRTARPVQK